MLVFGGCLFLRKCKPGLGQQHTIFPLIYHHNGYKIKQLRSLRSKLEA